MLQARAKLSDNKVNGLEDAIVSEMIKKLSMFYTIARSFLEHGTVVRTTMYLASLDIKTAFDDAKPKHVA